MTYDVTMTSLLKQWENLDLLETRKTIYHLKGNDESSPKKVFFIEIEEIASVGHSGTQELTLGCSHINSLIICKTRIFQL